MSGDASRVPLAADPPDPAQTVIDSKATGAVSISSHPRILSVTYYTDTLWIPGMGGENPETTNKCDDTTGQTPTRVEHGEVQPGANTQAQHVEDHNTGM